MSRIRPCGDDERAAIVAIVNGAAEAYRAVSGCLQILHEAAVEHGGSVDKYLGDCILAVFGAPIALEDAPRAAVNAAIEMRRRVREY